MRRIISICKEVPLLPIAIIAAIPLALLGSWRPWEAAGVSLTFGPFNPGVGQWIVIALVVYTIVVTVIGMIDDLRHGHVGVDLLAVIAIASTVAVPESWAAWAVVLMISSGEAIEEFAQSKAEGNLTALVDAAPRTAHVVTLPGVGARAAAAGADGTAGDAEGDMTADGFRKGASVDVPNAAETNKSTTQTKPYDAAGEHFETVPVDQVKLGDVILVLPGETVPVDGELLSGVATSAGSTGCGIKMVRMLILVKQARREMTRLVHPRAVQPVRLGDAVVDNRVIFSVLAFMLVYGATVIGLSMLLLLTDLDPVTAFSAVLASVNCAGPGLGAVGPASNFAVLTDFQVWVCTLAMLLGRLEILSFMAVLTPAFWRR